MERIYERPVPARYAGRRLGYFLQNSMEISSSLLKKLKETPGGLTVNGVERRVDFILSPGDHAAVKIIEGASARIEPQPGELEILYEDEDLIAVNKPPGMATHISKDHYDRTLSNLLLYYLNRNGSPHTFHGVTRLDKMTAGIVLAAKNAYVHHLLEQQLRQKQLHKEYECIVPGGFDRPAGIIEAPIRRAEGSVITRCVAADGKYAFTKYQVLHQNADRALIRVFPITGRTHQIRVHMAYINHPLAGDELYGGGSGGFSLCCTKLEFIHPITKIPLQITAPRNFQL